MKKYKPLLFILAALAVSCGPPHRNKIAITERNAGHYRVAVELVLKDSMLRDSLLCQVDKIPLDRYQWKNHIVLFGNPTDTTGIASLIRQSGIPLTVNYYNRPFYVFDRAEHCGNCLVDKPWKDYLLTANLVEDSLLQQEYINVHKTQFDEWPEVAQGFCNAGFQQLLAFRNGRQLLLAISIPPGKTLDELNPKTEENNPRMIEWNSLMSKYQEGIDGTTPGETWVFLNQTERFRENKLRE